MFRVLTRRRLVVAIAAVVTAVAGAGGTALALTTSASSHAVSMSRGDLARAALKVTAGTPFLDVSTGKLGGTLLRVWTPDDAPVRPVLSGSGLIVLSLAGTTAPHGSAGSRSSGTAGSAELDVSLPRPAGTVPFLLAGGVSLFRLSLPGGVPAQVTVGGGASFVSIDDQDLTGIAGGTVLTPPGWATASSRFDIDATSGFSRLTVSRWSAAGSQEPGVLGLDGKPDISHPTMTPAEVVRGHRNRPAQHGAWDRGQEARRLGQER
jgi:hypothetical protein